MKIVIGLLLVLVLQSSASAQEAKPFAWYKQHYPYMQHDGKTFTYESELEWPDGFGRLDSASLTPYQYWISHLPLWYRTRPVARVAGAAFEADKIACGLHLPWRTVRFYSYTIPVQLRLEYYLMRGDTAEFSWAPTAGDTITLERFLSGSPVAYRGLELRFQPADTRPRSDEEIDRLMDICAKWTNVGSLANNAVEVDSGDIKPGDMLIATAEVPTKGKVWTVLVVLVNDKGEKRYLVGTGCDFGCDFYIPLANDRKEFPWLSHEQLLALPGDYPNYGFYRFPISF